MPWGGLMVKPVSPLIVPMLCVGMHLVTLCVTADAERPWRRSHAERGNDPVFCADRSHVEASNRPRGNAQWVVTRNAQD
ncbi:hypothetical protein C1893_11435 [Pseudomonas sp. MPR-ANC1]|nr:hypothetical protein C1893_11435 [Pseudomonas sp. MPR-ANC1]